MKLKLFTARLRQLWQTRRSAFLWSLAGSIILVGAGIFFVGSFVSSRVVNRTNLGDVPTVDFRSFEASLSGLMVDRLDAARPVTGVMIENSPDARPQSGLDDAEVVFEAIAEGGITRFVAFYQVNQPTKLGPVRSVRPHFVDWVRAFDSSIAHAGGSAAGLSQIRKYGVKDLDQFVNADYFYRDSSRFAPHNLYTSMKLLDAVSRKKGFDSSEFNGWTYDDGAPAEKITADKVSAVISSGLYDISYTYNKKRNEYMRSVGGVKHIDDNSGKQIGVNNVIIMEVPYSIGGIYYNYDLVGTGNAKLFKNGEVLNIKWSRTSNKAPFRWLRNDEEVTLNRGQTWVTAIKPGNKVKVVAEEPAAQ